MKPEKTALEMTVVESPKTGLPTTLEIAARFPHSHRTTTAIFFLETFSERSLPHRLHLSLQAHSSIRKDSTEKQGVHFFDKTAPR